VLVNKASKIVVTPQLLAEVANITFEARHIGGFDLYFSKLVSFLKLTHEAPGEKSVLMNESNLGILRLVGFADTSIVNVARDMELLVLTDDGPLTGILNTLRIDTLNLNHIRSAQWLAGI
jgi:hypothetical protein